MNKHLAINWIKIKHLYSLATIIGKKQKTITSITTIWFIGSYEKYLGFPSLVGRARSKYFKGILDRVRSKLRNWKLKFLSQARKEILIKLVLKTIPIYSIGVYKLPKGLLQEINKFMQDYWLGQIGQVRRVQWTKWD